ncbi:hypothetical protein JTB14_002062 [Gonioctena quinquepunctata]|nr:hypothetical protein JTB14_002062 [Gonioctena quinquepunctata]
MMRIYNCDCQGCNELPVGEPSRGPPECDFSQGTRISPGEPADYADHHHHLRGPPPGLEFYPRYGGKFSKQLSPGNHVEKCGCMFCTNRRPVRPGNPGCAR